MSAQVLAFPKTAPSKEFQPLVIVKHNEFKPLQSLLNEIRTKNIEKQRQALIAASRIVDQAKWARLREEEQQALRVI